MSADLALNSIANALRAVEVHSVQYAQDIEKTTLSLRRAEEIRKEAYLNLDHDSADPEALRALKLGARYERPILQKVLDGVEESYSELYDAEQRLLSLNNPSPNIRTGIQELRKLLVLHALVRSFIVKRSELVVTELLYVENPKAELYKTMRKKAKDFQESTQKILAASADADKLNTELTRWAKLQLREDNSTTFKDASGIAGCAGAFAGVLLTAHPSSNGTIEYILIGALGGLVLSVCGYLDKIRSSYAEMLAKSEFKLRQAN